MSNHAKLSPSSSHRWIPCPGSVAVCKDLPNPDTEASAEGTLAHRWAAVGLTTGGVFCEDEEMRDHLGQYVNHVRERSKGKVLLVEQKVSVEKFTSEVGGFGTADCIIFDPESCHLEIIDLKYGYVVVHAEENPQLMIYALGAKDMLEAFGYEVKSVTMAIFQPRQQHYDEWTCDLEKLIEFGHYAASRGQIALAAMPGEDLHPDPEACEYCPFKTSCTPYEQAVHKIVFEQFTEVDGMPHAVARPVEGECTPGELDMVESWLKSKRAWIFEQLQAGAPLKSWKLVAGRAGNRKFIDEVAVEALLKKLRLKASQYKETSLKGIPALEKLVGPQKWEQFAPYIKQTPGQPQMVPISDKRPVYSPAAIEDFDDLTKSIDI